MASTPQYVRTGGQTYELTPGGYYKKVGSANGQVTDISSFGDWYNQQAKEQYEPMYEPIIKEQSSYYDTVKDQLLNSNKANYANAGLMDSSYFANKQSKLGQDTETQRAAALARLNLEKQNKMSGYVESLRGVQMQGDQWEQQQEAARQEQARQQAQWEQEMAWKREQMDLERQQQALQAQQSSRATSGSSGGSSKSSSTNNLKNQLASLASKYRTMDWGQMQQELQGRGIDPVYFRDWVYQNALKENPGMSQSAVRNLVYKQYFPDGWR